MTIVIRLKVTIVILLVLIKEKYMHLVFVFKHFFLVKKAFQLISIYLKFFSFFNIVIYSLLLRCVLFLDFVSLDC